jgi:hypothetical protein
VVALVEPDIHRESVAGVVVSTPRNPTIGMPKDVLVQHWRAKVEFTQNPRSALGAHVDLSAVGQPTLPRPCGETRVFDSDHVCVGSHGMPALVSQVGCLHGSVATDD